MNVQVEPFSLEGCACRLKMDPKELQALLHEKLSTRLQKNKKIQKASGGQLRITGRFTQLDQGNLGLHMMLCLLGKPKMVCEYTAEVDGQLLVQDTSYASACGAWFSSMRSLLRSDADLIAKNVVKQCVKALKKGGVPQPIG